MKFNDYNIAKEIKICIQEQGWKKPTDIQYKVIKPIIDGEDVLAIAQTGTGKTAGFAIPILNNIAQRKGNKYNKGVRALVMVPTRELAKQISDVFLKLRGTLPIKIAYLSGGVDQDPQIAQLNNGVDIVVSTPGRMFDLISQGHLDLSRVETLVLDEADHMLDLGFIKDIQDVKKHLPKKHQTLFFSATIDKKIKKLAYSLVKDAIRIQISPKDPVSKNVDHQLMYVEMDDKRFFLESLLKQFDDAKFVIFVRTKVRAERVKAAMERVQVSAETIHGDIPQKDRFNILNRFKSGENKVLITTDVTARGIDIPEVEYVVNYDLPDVAENYVHRIGRTGRGTNKGNAISFCSESEKEYLAEIETFIGKPIKVYTIDKSEYQEILLDTDDGTDDWQSLLKEENKRAGTDDVW